MYTLTPYPPRIRDQRYLTPGRDMGREISYPSFWNAFLFHMFVFISFCFEEPLYYPKSTSGFFRNNAMSKVGPPQKQECIPVGCVPPAAVAVGEGSVCLSACKVWVWRPPPGVGLETCKACWDTTPPPPQRPAARHAEIPPPMHAGILPSSPPDRMTDTCKNIPFANFVCGR